jgi:hypothetical protein
LDPVIQKYTPQIVTPSQILVAIPVNNLAPGKTNHYWWNNATPSVAVWYIRGSIGEKFLEYDRQSKRGSGDHKGLAQTKSNI